MACTGILTSWSTYMREGMSLHIEIFLVKKWGNATTGALWGIPLKLPWGRITWDWIKEVGCSFGQQLLQKCTHIPQGFSSITSTSQDCIQQRNDVENFPLWLFEWPFKCLWQLHVNAYLSTVKWLFYKPAMLLKLIKNQITDCSQTTVSLSLT